MIKSIIQFWWCSFFGFHMHDWPAWSEPKMTARANYQKERRCRVCNAVQIRYREQFRTRADVEGDRDQ